MIAGWIEGGRWKRIATRATHEAGTTEANRQSFDCPSSSAPDLRDRPIRSPDRREIRQVLRRVVVDVDVPHLTTTFRRKSQP
jgi:hypothetical protein